MDVPLDPRVAGKIRAFGRRRRRLILARGACAGVALLLGIMSAVAFLDWLIVLSDPVRLALSLAGYAGILAGVWFTCARMVFRTPGDRELARFMEQTEPSLREDLLSAVELGGQPFDPRWDSEAFRRRLQDDVAHRMDGVRVERLLSYGRIKAWFRAAAAITAACVLLLLVPGLSYDRLLMRSLFPTANIERVSRVRVTIIEPSPAEGIVPQGDMVAVRVETEGPDPGRTFLEIFPREGRSERVEMTRMDSANRFESGIPMGRDPVEYRIRAGDAVTRKYALRTHPRPEVRKFRKTYNYPEYTGKPSREVVEDGGDLAELEGTIVDLLLEVDQEVKVAQLRVERGDKKSSVINLEPAGPGKRRGQVSLSGSGTYRVHLVAEGTGFENKFSPEYEIRAVPDLVPRVTIDEPKQDLILPHDDVVVLKGTAKDDLGLRTVAQMTRVNQAEWVEAARMDKLGAEAAFSRRWDLLDMGLQPGDRVGTKLVAVDLKGNTAESTPVHVVISSPEFDPQRLASLKAKQAVYEAFVILRVVLRSLQERAREAAQAGAAADELQRKQTVIAFLGEADKVMWQADATEACVKEALQVARAGREADDQIQMGILVGRIREEGIQGARAEVDRAGETPAAGDLKRAQDLLGAAVGRASLAEDEYRKILATEECMTLLNDLQDIVREQAVVGRQVAEGRAAKDPNVWERLARRQGVAVDRIKGSEELLRSLGRKTPAGKDARLEKIREGLQARRADIEKALAAPPGEPLAALSTALEKEAAASLAALRPVDDELAKAAAAGRMVLAQKTEPSHADIANLVGEVQEDRVLDRWKGVIAQLKSRAALEELRKDSDAVFVSDVDLAMRALEGVRETHLNVHAMDATKKTLDEVLAAFRTLETGHVPAALAEGLRGLMEAERWEGSTFDAVARRPKDWAWMGVQAKATAEIAKSMQGPEAKKIDLEMSQRSTPGRPPVGVSKELDPMTAVASAARDQVKPAMEAARTVLRKLIRPLVERLEALAKDAENLEQLTRGAAQKAPQSPAEQVRQEARKLLEGQQEVGLEVKDLSARLRREANVQDVMTKEGREKARDADDAALMMKDAPPQAEERLGEAATGSEPKAQEDALRAAAEQQGNLAKAARKLAEHYKNAEAGRPEETRDELRKAEEAAGVKQEMDEQYGQMEKLAEMSRQSPESQMNQLEEALAKNPAMKDELERIARNAVERAKEALQEAVDKEKKVEEGLKNAADAQAQKEPGLAEKAKRLAEEARKLGKEAAGQKAPAEAKPEMNKAGKGLEQAADRVPQEFSRPAEAASQMSKAAQEMKEAAKDLQQASQKAAPAAAQAKDQLQKAQAMTQATQEAAQQAERNAREAAQKAQGDPSAAQQAQESAQKAAAAQQAAKQAQSAQQAADQAAKDAQGAQDGARQAGEKASKLAEQAEQMGKDLEGQAKSDAAKLGEAAAQQPPIGEAVEEAADDMARAAHHERRMGNEEKAHALEQVQQGSQSAAQNEVPSAQKAAQSNQRPGDAQPAAGAAKEAIQKQLDALNKQGEKGSEQGDSQQGDSQSQEGSLSEQAAQQMARAMDQLDSKMHGHGKGEGKGKGEGEGQDASQSMSQAAQAQAQAMRQGRSQGGGAAGMTPGSGAGMQGGSSSNLPQLQPMDGKEWGKLPPRLARDLMEAQREAVPEEYRAQVDLYFRIVAERARETK